MPLSSSKYVRLCVNRKTVLFRSEKYSRNLKVLCRNSDDAQKLYMIIFPMALLSSLHFQCKIFLSAETVFSYHLLFNKPHERAPHFHKRFICASVEISLDRKKLGENSISKLTWALKIFSFCHSLRRAHLFSLNFTPPFFYSSRLEKNLRLEGSQEFSTLEKLVGGKFARKEKFYYKSWNQFFHVYNFASCFLV